MLVINIGSPNRPLLAGSESRRTYRLMLPPLEPPVPPPPLPGLDELEPGLELEPLPGLELDPLLPDPLLPPAFMADSNSVRLIPSKLCEMKV